MNTTANSNDTTPAEATTTVAGELTAALEYLELARLRLNHAYVEANALEGLVVFPLLQDMATLQKKLTALDEALRIVA